MDFLSVLKDINVNSLTLVQTTLNALVYEIMNRPEFTKFFSVSNSMTYINAGYNASSIDVSVYNGSIMEMLEDLAKGHSIFYVDPDNGYFYFKPADPTLSVIYSFLETNNRKLEGVDRQINQWYWEDTTISATSFPAPVNPRSSNFKIEGIINDTQRQNTLNAVLARSEDAKPYFKLQLPYFPILKLLDRVVVQSFGSAPRDAVRWGMFLWTSSSTSNPNTAPRWRKPAGIRISSDDQWMVRSIAHDSNLRTTVELEKIL